MAPQDGRRQAMYAIEALRRYVPGFENARLRNFGMALGTAELAVGNAHIRVGTPYYTAPEIWAGGKASVASDLYALGATWFHLLTGRPPFPGDTIAAALPPKAGRRVRPSIGCTRKSA